MGCNHNIELFILFSIDHIYSAKKLVSTLFCNDVAIK